MTWLERPAAVYTRHEVVVHRLDHPLIKVDDSKPGFPVTYEIWEARIVYVFDAHSARWSMQSIEQLGNRKHSKTTRIVVPGRHPEVARLVALYEPDWIPDPSKARLHLPAEDVWDEAATQVGQCPEDHAMYVPSWLREQNPYRGE